MMKALQTDLPFIARLKTLVPISLLVCFTIISLTGCAAVKESIRLGKVLEHKAGIASKATYDQSFSEIWGVLYSTISEDYTIARESESRGYIESELVEKSSSSQESERSIAVELLGDEPPFRIVVRAETKKRTFNKDKGRWSNWKKGRDKKAENKLKVKIHERLNGEISLPPELQAP